MKTIHMKKLVLGLLGLFATMAGQSQSVPPLVYELEHTGASFDWPEMPDVSELPIQRELPNALEGVSDFSQWERRRSGSLYRQIPAWT